LILGLGFTRQYGSRHRPYQLWWGISFIVTALAAAVQFIAFINHAFSPTDYRLYIVFSASVPAVMGAGTMFLLWARWAWYYTGLVLLFILLTAVGAFSGSVSAGHLGDVMYASQAVTHVITSFLVILGYAVLGSVGATAIVLGALWSWWRTRQIYNLGIALGGVVFSLADTLAAYGITAIFFLAQIVGIVVLYWAVDKSRAPETRTSRVGDKPVTHP
ncbi:MAG: hypothetical protein ACP5QO_11335, partial [Clostridia bacterium]